MTYGVNCDLIRNEKDVIDICSPDNSEYLP